MRFSVFRPLFDQQFQAFDTVANGTEISWDVSWVKLSLTKYLQMFSVFYPLAYWLTKKKNAPLLFMVCQSTFKSQIFPFFFRFNFPFNFAFVFVISLFLLDCLFRYSLFFTRLVWKFVLFNECWIKLLLLLLLCFLRHNVFHCLITTCSMYAMMYSVISFSSVVWTWFCTEKRLREKRVLCKGSKILLKYKSCRASLFLPFVQY